MHSVDLLHMNRDYTIHSSRSAKCKTPQTKTARESSEIVSFLPISSMEVSLQRAQDEAAYPSYSTSVHLLIRRRIKIKITITATWYCTRTDNPHGHKPGHGREHL